MEENGHGKEYNNCWIFHLWISNIGSFGRSFAIGIDSFQRKELMNRKCQIYWKWTKTSLYYGVRECSPRSKRTISKEFHSKNIVRHSMCRCVLLCNVPCSNFFWTIHKSIYYCEYMTYNANDHKHPNRNITTAIWSCRRTQFKYIKWK